MVTRRQRHKVADKQQQKPHRDERYNPLNRTRMRQLDNKEFEYHHDQQTKTDHPGDASGIMFCKQHRRDRQEAPQDGDACLEKTVLS